MAINLISTLLVVQESKLRRCLRGVLEKNSQLQIESCAGVQEALEILSARPFHIIYTDLELEDGSGIELTESIKQKMPEAKIEGVTVQPMFDAKDAIELILGIKKDPIFGTSIMIGMGGTAAELFMDKSLGFPPLNETLALRMIKNLKIYPLLKGYRGSEPKAIDKLIEIMIRMSYLAADYPEIAELDINPLLLTTKEAVALDARIVLDKEAIGKKFPEYSHLLLHPYPEKLVKKSKLNDGTPITLRPIKPEDEPLWLDLLGSCSKESIYSRFRYNFHYDSHEIATQFCYIDYVREVAIVAEIKEKGKKKLIGVGRLIADPDLTSVEYAILITDAFQKRELGTILTNYCIEIAKKWKMNKIFAETTKDNKAMVAVFKKLGFEVTYNSDNTVSVARELK